MKCRARLLVAALVLSSAGSACLDFDKAQTRFCVNADPAQRRDVCSVSHAAIRITVSYGSYEPACIRVTASDSQGKQERADIQRQEFLKFEQREVIIAVGRKEERPRELVVEVASYEASAGEACGGSVLEAHVSDPIAIPPGKFGTFEITLQARDNDNDGHALRTEGVAGTDCNDENADVHPDAQEACDATEDYNCDGQAGCADPECLDQACDDGDACTMEDRCMPGAGTAPECRGIPKQCDPPNLSCYTSETVCFPSTGECVFTQQPTGTGCDDSNACTAGDQCAVDATCQGATVQCRTPPNTACYEETGACSLATGECSYIPRPQATACDDGNACTANQCDGSGNCLAESLPLCEPSSVCYLSGREDCPESAACTERADPSKVNTPCTVNGRSGVCRQGDGVCSSFPFIPSNFDPDSIAEAERNLDVLISCGSPTEPVIFDSTSLTWTPPAGCTLPAMPVAKVIGQGNSAMAVLPMRSLTIDAGKALKLRGVRPVILAVYGDARLSGVLLADADMHVPGAGGNRADCGIQSGQNGRFSTGNGSGGGGGGFGQMGASGGKNSANDAGGSAGVARSSTLGPLVGGCQGGTGGAEQNTPNGGLGGAGGGALQVAVAGTLRVEHWISVSGGGGGGGRASETNSGGGGGGGSGGGLLLEAFHLQILSPARLTANGGGGGEGGGDTNNGNNGADGAQGSGDPASGGSGVTSQGGNGGQGGAESVAAAAGGAPGGSDSSGGGGGGGVGVIRMQGFGGCSIDTTCNSTDGLGCDISPRVSPICP